MSTKNYQQHNPRHVWLLSTDLDLTQGLQSLSLVSTTVLLERIDVPERVHVPFLAPAESDELIPRISYMHFS